MCQNFQNGNLRKSIGKVENNGAEHCNTVLYFCLQSDRAMNFPKIPRKPAHVQQHSKPVSFTLSPLRRPRVAYSCCNHFLSTLIPPSLFPFSLPGAMVACSNLHEAVQLLISMGISFRKGFA